MNRYAVTPGQFRQPRKHRCTAIILLISILLFSAAYLPSAAPAAAVSVDNIYFFAAAEHILPLSDETMPFWSGGYLYISSSVFTDPRVEEDLGISRVQDRSRGLLSLYGGKGSLSYQAGEIYALGDDGSPYVPGMIRHNGEYYVPASVVAAYFDLQYSLTETEYGWLVWLRQEDFRIPDRVFADAQSAELQSRYNEYSNSRGTGAEPEPPVLPPSPVPTRAPVPPQPPAASLQTPSGTPVPSTAVPTEQPPTLPPSPTPTPEIFSGNQNLYFFLNGTDSTAAVLDVLDRAGVSAAVFCGADFLSEQGGLLRRMTVSGCSVGLAVDAAVSGTESDAAADTPAAGLDGMTPDSGRMTVNSGAQTADSGVLRTVFDANHMLEQAACQKTRLILTGNPDIMPILSQAGYICFDDADSVSVQTLRTAAQARELLRQVSRRDTPSVFIRLDGEITQQGLAAFVSAAAEIGDFFPFPDETAFLLSG